MPIIDELVFLVRAKGGKEAKKELEGVVKELDKAKQVEKDRAKAEKEAAKAVREKAKAEKNALSEQRRAEKTAETERKNELKERARAERDFERERLRLRKEVQRAIAQADREATMQEKLELKERVNAARAAAREQERVAREAAARQGRIGDLRRGAIGRASSALNTAGGLAARFATGGALAAGGALVGSVTGLTERANDVKTSAAAIAMSAEQLQEWRFIAKASNVDAANFADGLRQMSSQLRASAVAGGKGEAATAIEQLGLNFQEFIKLKPDAQLKLLADEFAKTGRSASKNAAFMRIFGEESGSKFAEMLEGGSAAIEKQRKRAHELGAVLSDETLAAADNVAEQMREMGVITSALSARIGEKLLPIASKLVERFSDWALQNREIIAARVEEWVTKIVDGAVKLVPLLEKTVKLLADMAKFAVEWGKEMATAFLAAKAGIAAAQLVEYAIGLKKALDGVKVAAALAGGSTGVGLIVAGLVAAIPLAMKLGDLLGDIGAQGSVDRSLSAQMAGAKVVGGKLVGGEAFAESLAKMSPAQLAIEDRKLQMRIANNQNLSGDARAQADANASATANVLFRARQIKEVRALQARAGKMQEEDAAGKTGDPDQFFRGAGGAGLKPADVSAIADLADKRIISRSAERAILGPRTRQLSEGRTAIEERPITAKELKKLLAQGEITRQDFDVLRGATSFFTPDKGAVGDAELLKLINAAAQSGQNLDTLLGGRKIEGGTPPVITVTVSNNNVTVEAQVNVSSSAAGAMDVARATVVQFEAQLGTVLSKYLPTPQVAR